MNKAIYKNNFTTSKILFIAFPIIALNLSFKHLIGPYNINYLTILLGCIIIIYEFIILGNFIHFRYSYPLLLFLLTYLISNIYNYKSIRLSSLLYSIFFLILFEIYKKYIEKYKIYEVVKYIFKLVYILYIILAIIQFVCAIFNSVYIPNIISSDIDNKRFNSFSTEPSYAGIILVALFYLNTGVFNDHKFNLFKNKKDKINFIFFIVSLLIINSGYGLICFFILIIYYFFKLKNNIIKYVILFILFIIIISLIINIKYFINSNNYSFSRIAKIINIIPTILSNNTQILSIDHSAAMRIVPNIIYINMLKEFNFKEIIGYGMDYSQKIMAILIPGIEEKLGLGFLPLFLINFGLISSITFIVYLNKNLMISKLPIIDKIFEIIIITITFSNSNFNTPLFWSVILIFYTNNYYMQLFKRKLD